MRIEHQKFFENCLIISILAIGLMVIVYGLLYVFGMGFPVRLYLFLLIFAILFVIGATFFEKRGGVFPWYLAGGALFSLITTLLTSVIYAGILYIIKNGINLYAISLFIILSMVVLSGVFVSILKIFYDGTLGRVHVFLIKKSVQQENTEKLKQEILNKIDEVVKKED